MIWRPLATAPTDETTVLLWQPPVGPYSGRMVLGSFREDDMRGDLGPMWLENDYDDFSCGMASTPVSATHWMPLPPPPTPDRSGEADETRSGSAEGESGLPEGSSK